MTANKMHNVQTELARKHWSVQILENTSVRILENTTCGSKNQISELVVWEAVFLWSYNKSRYCLCANAH